MTLSGGSAPGARGTRRRVSTRERGVVVAIARELNLPIRYVGVGEKAVDLLPFEPAKFIDSLFAS